jgi:transmembrane sensor
MINAPNDSINELITKFLTGESTSEEQNRLFDWINQSQENKRYYEDYRKAFDLTEKHFMLSESTNLPIDINQEWIHFTDTIRLQRPVRKLSLAQVWLRAAAAVLLVAATAAILFYYSLDKMVVYQTAENKQTVTLPDGSEITLNRFTTIAYEPDFGTAMRSVNLKGEAFFDVKPDADKPFIIQTEKARIQVLGTSFNVNAYDTLSEVEVIVQTGMVSLETKKGSQSVKLTPGQKGVFSKTNESLTSSTNTDVNFLSWRTQRLVFVENDLGSVIDALRKTYHADIIVSANVPESCIVTVTFEGQSLESVLKVLENTLNLKYTINGNKVVITEAGC